MQEVRFFYVPDAATQTELPQEEATHALRVLRIQAGDELFLIDGDMSKAYVLNSNFIYDFGTYTSGSTYYSIPQLEPGKHELTFRASTAFSSVTLQTYPCTFSMPASL